MLKLYLSLYYNEGFWCVVLGGGGGGGFGGAGGEYIVQEDTIFVSGMNPQTSESAIHEHFGAIGIIKVRKTYLKNSTFWLKMNM